MNLLDVNGPIKNVLPDGQWALNFPACEAVAKAMGILQLTFALSDLAKVIEASRTWDNKSCEGYYYDEASVYRRELTHKRNE